MLTILVLAAVSLQGADGRGFDNFGGQQNSWEGAVKANSPAMKVLKCEACHSVMKELSLDVKFLVESNKMWKQDVLRERISVSCGDPGIANGALKDACGYMMADYHKGIATEVSSRWDEDSDEFEEDIVPKEFCLKVGICKENHKSLTQMISTSDQKQKDMKEEQEEKERLKGKAKIRYDMDDGEDEDEESAPQWSQAEAAL